MQTHEFHVAEMIGMLGPSVADDLNGFGRAGWRLVSYDSARHVAVFERPVTVEQPATTAEPAGGTDV